MQKGREPVGNVERILAVRKFCEDQILHDHGTLTPRSLTDRAWCAQGVLNILDGCIDDQL